LKPFITFKNKALKVKVRTVTKQSSKEAVEDYSMTLVHFGDFSS